MSQEIIIPHLIRSLESVRQFANGEAEFFKGSEFMELHLMNIKFLKELSEQKKHPYFIEKISEYPSIGQEELDKYLNKKNEKGRYWNYDYRFLDTIRMIYNLITSDGKFVDGILSRLNEISSINENIIYVFRNPGMEELIQSSKKTK